MRTIAVQPLTQDTFFSFGFFAAMIDPSGEKIGEKPIEFFRDRLQLDLGGAPMPSFSVCRVEPREMVVDVTEYHSICGEGILPLDGDVIIHVGPASESNTPPLDRFRAFRVPQGIMVVLRPGVWHHAPFSVDGRPSNVLIVLPERTYANDCTVVELEADERIAITG
jgi:ureidoglycolate lyase